MFSEPTAWRRIRTLLSARLAAGPRGGLPVAALLTQALIATTFCALVRDALAPFAYALFALTLSGALIAIPLLGELGWLLRRDEAEEWAASLPIRPLERKLARLLHLLGLLGALALAALIPAALVAPGEMALLGRLALPLLGLGLAALLAAALLSAQSAFGERAESLLLVVQTVLVVAVVLGLVLGMRSIPALARLPSLGDEPLLWLVPPAWFAGPFGEPALWWVPVLVTAVSLAVLAATPAPPAPRRRRGPSWLDLLLSPVRGLAARIWVRKDERGAFDLVADALPREREVMLRTVPMLGIPLAFLVVSAQSSDPLSGSRGDILALLLFTSAVYLPILLTHVPATATPGAVWLMRTAPVSEGAIVSGAIKALGVRFLVPLYVLLAFIAWTQAGFEPVIRLALPGFLISLLVLRRLYPVCVTGSPLSTAPDEIRFDMDWIGLLGGLALFLTLLAVLASRFLGPSEGLLAALLLIGLEWISGRRLRGRLG